MRRYRVWWGKEPAERLNLSEHEAVELHALLWFTLEHRVLVKEPVRVEGKWLTVTREG